MGVAMADTPDTYFYVPISKVEDVADGSVRIYGRPASDSVDLDGQIADKDWLKKALPEWFHSYANIREMHQPSAVGVGEKLEWDKDDDPWLTALIVDPVAAKKVKAGVYKAFSFGAKSPEIRPDKNAKKGRIVGGRIVEESIVDHPSNLDCPFTIRKAIGMNDWLDCQSGMILTNPNALQFMPELLDVPALAVLDVQDDHIITRMGAEIYKVAVSTEDGKAVFGEVTKLSDVTKADDKKPPHIGLSDDAKSKFLSAAKNDPSVHCAAAMRRLSQWAASGSYPTGLNYGDLKWMYDQYASILKDRDPKSAAGGNFPPEKAAEAEAVLPDDEKCQSLTSTLGNIKDQAQSKTKEVKPDMTDEEKRAAALADIKKAAESKVYCGKCKRLVDMKDGKDHEIGKSAMTVGKCAVCGSELRKAVVKAADPTPAKPTGAEAAELSILTQLEGIIAAGRAIEDSEAKGTPAAEEKENALIAKIKELAAKWEGIQHKETVPIAAAVVPDCTDGKCGKCAKCIAAAKAVVPDCTDGKCGKCSKCLAAAKTFGTDSGMQPHDLTGAKAAGTDLAAIVKAAVAEVMKGIMPDAYKAARKDKVDKLNAKVDALKELLTKADFGNVGGPESVPGESGTIAVQFRDIMNDMNTLAGEIVRDYGNGQFGLGEKTTPPAVDMGQAKPLTPTETWNERGKDALPDLIKAISDAMQAVSAETVKSTGAQLTEILEPLRQRLETVEHSAKPASPPVTILTEAERLHALAGDTTKTAVSERVFADRIAAEIPDANQRQRVAAMLIEQMRAGR